MHISALARFARKLSGLDERRDHAVRAPVDLGENARFGFLTFKNGDDQRVAFYFMKLSRIRLYFHFNYSSINRFESRLYAFVSLNPRPVLNRRASLAFLRLARFGFALVIEFLATRDSQFTFYQVAFEV